VLPFKSLGVESGNEYLGMGMADTLITRLSNLKEIIIRPTSSVLKYADRDTDTIEIGRELGVDIEKERRVDVLGIARRYFSPSEYLALVSVPEERRLGAFCRCWTRKESLLKARGDGLAFPLDGFEVSLAETAPQLLVACANAPTELDRWTMASVPVDPGYAGAVTGEGQGWRLTCWDNLVQE